MNNTQYDNDGNIVKKPFQIRIAGFTFGKKSIIVFIVIVLSIICLSVGEKVKRDKEDAKAIAEAEARNKALAEASKNKSGDFDFHKQMQEALSRQYGEAPEGFEWSYTGELVSKGDDDSATAEDVVYMFLRSLSILDLSTATRYSDDSEIISSYKNFYTDYGDINDYYSNFLRKQFKKSITSLEINNVTDTAVLADGTEYVTLSLDILDLTDKDFWKKDRKNLWKELRVYKETEGDAVKLDQHVYDYIYEKYEDGTVGKRTVTIELVVSKQNGKGWLVSGDGELNAMLQYENGVDVAGYILDAFDDWYQKTTLKEQLEEIKTR